jgi:hypothetical protein
MRKLIRPLAAVVYIACLVVSSILVSAGSAMTEDQVASPVKQMALTKKKRRLLVCTENPIQVYRMIESAKLAR